MHSRYSLLLLLSLSIPFGNNFAQSPDELFSLARMYYTQKGPAGPWPYDKPSGLKALQRAADGGHAAALYNMYLGYQFGYLGDRNPVKAAEYRERWLLASESPSRLLEAGLGNLGFWPEPEDPERTESAGVEFILTGDFPQRNRRNTTDFGFFGGRRSPESATKNFTNAVRSLTQAVSLGASVQHIIASEKAASEEALSVLVNLCSGYRFSFTFQPRSKRIPPHTIEVIPPSPEEIPHKGQILAAILSAQRSNLKIPSDCSAAQARITRVMSNDEFMSAFLKGKDK